jgi:hypothetical protein
LYPPPAQTEKSSPDFASENINIGEDRKKNKLQTLLQQRAKKGEKKKEKNGSNTGPQEQHRQKRKVSINDAVLSCQSP